MKNFFFFLCFIAASATGISQPYNQFFISDGEMTPDFNKTIFASGGVWFHLFEYLDAGKTVYLFSFETTDPSGWDYHTSNTLQIFFANHGPDGDNTVMAVSSPESGTSNDIYGTSDESQGNWMYYMTYPLVRNIGGYKNFNTSRVIRICPDRSMFDMGFPDSAALVQSMGLCEYSTQTVDTKVHYSHTDTITPCPGENRLTSAMICNMGTDTLYSTDVVVSTGDDIQQTYHWEGALATYQIDTITFDDVALSGLATDLKIYTTAPNGLVDQNPTNDTLRRPLQGVYYWGSNLVKVKIQTDGYGHQIYWDIMASDSTIIGSGGNELVGEYDGIIAPSDGSQYSDDTYYEELVDLTGFDFDCVTLRVLSGDGYGTCCTWGNGYIRFLKDEQVIFNFTDFGRRAYAKIMPTFNLQPLEVSYIPTHVANNASNGSITFEPSYGVPPYQHSIDCGQNFGYSPVYDSLSAGVYCVHTKDHIGNLVIDSVEITNADSLTTTYNQRSNGATMIVQPNPVRDVIMVTIMGENFGNEAKLTLINAVGTSVATYTLHRQGENLTTILDVSKLPDGIYVLLAQDESGKTVSAKVLKE